MPSPFLCFVIFFQIRQRRLGGFISRYLDPLSSGYGSSVPRGLDKWGWTVIVSLQTYTIYEIMDINATFRHPHAIFYGPLVVQHARFRKAHSFSAKSYLIFSRSIFVSAPLPSSTLSEVLFFWWAQSSSHWINECSLNPLYPSFSILCLYLKDISFWLTCK